jgi:hypothetical protein
MRLPISSVAKWGLPLICAINLWACTREVGPGVTVVCEGGANPKAWVTVKNPHSRVRLEPGSPWITELTAKLADFKSAEEACAAIFDLAKQLELRVELKDKTTVVIYGRDLEVSIPPGLRVKIEKLDRP